MATRIQMQANGTAIATDPEMPGSDNSSNYRDPRSVNIQTRVGGSDRVVYRDGITTYETEAPTQVSVKQVTPGRVMVDGYETSEEAARAAGLLDKAVVPQNSVQYREMDRPMSEQKQEEQEAPRKELKDQTKDQTKWEPPLSEEIAAGAEVIAQLDSQIGSDAVNANVSHVVRTGELPDTLPAGVSEEQVQAIYNHYEGLAESMLHGTGATIETLEAAFTANELVVAREAVVSHDVRAMRALATIALERLRGA